MFIFPLGLGYFAGVCDSLSITISVLESPPGREYLSTREILPPSSPIPLAAASASASASAGLPLRAKKLPPGLTSGRQYSQRTLRRATALAVATSYFSLSSNLPRSSALPWISSASIPSELHTSYRKPSLLARLSKSVSLISGRISFMGIPGKPAPVPTSIRLPP